jgi:hypothetical protein
MLAQSQTVQDLQRARNLIADPEHWSGEVGVGDRYCAIQADLYVRGIPDEPCGASWWKVSPYLVAAARELFPRYRGSDAWAVFNVNDNEGHVATLAMYDRAIQLAMAGA